VLSTRIMINTIDVIDYLGHMGSGYFAKLYERVDIFWWNLQQKFKRYMKTIYYRYALTHIRSITVINTRYNTVNYIKEPLWRTLLGTILKELQINIPSVYDYYITYHDLVEIEPYTEFLAFEMFYGYTDTIECVMVEKKLLMKTLRNKPYPIHSIIALKETAVDDVLGAYINDAPIHPELQPYAQSLSIMYNLTSRALYLYNCYLKRIKPSRNDNDNDKLAVDLDADVNVSISIYCYELGDLTYIGIQDVPLITDATLDFKPIIVTHSPDDSFTNNVDYISDDGSGSGSHRGDGSDDGSDDGGDDCGDGSDDDCGSEVFMEEYDLYHEVL